MRKLINLIKNIKKTSLHKQIKMFKFENGITNYKENTN